MSNVFDIALFVLMIAAVLGLSAYAGHRAEKAEKRAAARGYGRRS